MTGILPTHYPQPVPGEYYPPMSPQPSTVNATDGARPVTAEEYNRIYSQIGLSGNMAASTTITMPAQTGVDTSAVPSSSVNIAPAPSIPMSPAMTHTNTISSPASMVASPYMPNTTGGISVVASPYMNSGTPVGGSAGASATRLSSLQPAPAMPYPALPPAPTLTQPFTPPSPNPPASSPATPAISMASPATTASTPSYGYASLAATTHPQMPQLEYELYSLSK
ncbi:hypothetical protein BGZ73_007504 [Actinomortierella ambigua]|nr:hypothetical protein BGZ73_007504 [Actinomortierella ambigua]